MLLLGIIYKRHTQMRNFVTRIHKKQVEIVIFLTKFAAERI